MPLISFSRSVRLVQLLALCVAASTQYKDNSPLCSCYYVDSDDDPLFFINHRFYDFRSAATSPYDYRTPPPPSTSVHDAALSMTPDQQYLNDTAWNNDWGIMSWGKNGAGFEMQNAADNVFMTQTNSSDLGSANSSQTTYLTLRAVRLPSFQSSAEIENENKNLMYASLRMRARVVGARGAVAGFFTYYDDSNESDIEILTDDNATTWRFSDQPSVDAANNAIPQSMVAPTDLPPWDGWREHRIDWTPGVVRWFVDGAFAASNTYSVPRKPSGLVMNVWSDGGDWSGNMSVGTQAELHVQWVQLVFNTSGPRTGAAGGNRMMAKRRDDTEEERWGSAKKHSSRCKVVCDVDGANVTAGFPQVVYSAGGHQLGIPGLAWAVVAFAGVFALLGSL